MVFDVEGMMALPEDRSTGSITAGVREDINCTMVSGCSTRGPADDVCGLPNKLVRTVESRTKENGGIKFGGHQKTADLCDTVASAQACSHVEVAPQPAEIEEAVNPAQQVISGNVLIEVERVEESVLIVALRTHQEVLPNTVLDP